jgi:hypothetical protein
MRIPFWSFLLILAISLSASLAKAITIDMSGTLTSDNTAVSSTDPIITSGITSGSALSMVLTYDPTSYTQSGNSYVFTNAAFALSFDGYSFDYSSAAGNYIEMATPGAYGTGTVSFQICTSSAACSDPFGDFINLYYSGTVLSPATLAAQASGLSGYSSASPSEFEFLRNFLDGSQTDLQGTLNSPSVPPTVPEPGTFTLFASGLASLAALRWRFREVTSRRS